MAKGMFSYTYVSILVGSCVNFKGWPRIPHIHEFQNDLDLLYDWSVSNELNFNISKCVNLSFNNKIPTSYNINSTSLPD